MRMLHLMTGHIMFRKCRIIEVFGTWIEARVCMAFQGNPLRIACVANLEAIKRGTANQEAR